jgi:hypothetical protein
VLEENLIKARRDAPSEIDAAQADISRAWDYINRYDEDIRESLEDDLRAAEGKNNQAREELGRGKPDYFAVCKSARDANEAADRILIEARSEHEAAERLRSKAASSWRDASASVSIARKYIEDHHNVVKAEARTYLGTAEDAIRQLEAVSDANTRVSLANQAESAANQAYALARQDVDNSWQRPIPRDGTAGHGVPNVIIVPRVPSPSPRTSGGSSPWGSRRSSGQMPSGGMRRGGGSSGWSSRGGGGGRGGGSRGW